MRGLRAFAVAGVVAAGLAGAALAGPARGADPESEPVADMHAFASPDAESAAQRAVRGAERRFDGVDAAARDLIQRHDRDCAAPALTAAVADLQSIERDAGRYITLAETAPNRSDRVAAMDVLDELDAFVLDGYLRAAEALEMTRCAARAEGLYETVIKTYTGRSYAHWRARAAARLAAIRAGRLLSAP